MSHRGIVLFPLVALASALVVAGCTGADPASEPDAISAPNAPTTSTSSVDPPVQTSSPTAADATALPVPVELTAVTPTPGYQILIAASDIAVGKTRFPFVVIDPDGAFFEAAEMSVVFYSIDETTGDTGPVHRYPTFFRALQTEQPHVHEDGSTHVHIDSQGIYVVDIVEFNAPGVWGMRATALDPSETNAPIALEAFVRIADREFTPAIGAPAPRTDQITARDVQSLAEISTREPPLPALYGKTITEVLDEGQPFVVAFSTPAYCQSRICGPVLEEVIELLPEYPGQVEFIHVEPFDLAIIRGGNGFELVPAAVQWGIPSEPWIFVVDAQGLVAAKFEGIVTAPELRRAIDAIVGS